jgi:hypothetical protein
MADKRISALPGASTPLAGTEVLPIVQGGDTVKVTVANLTAGRAVAMAGGSFTDNITQGTAAKGINFTANTPAEGMTSQLLNWYEEGTWTPTDASGAGLSLTANYAKYVRTGKLVTINLYITYPTTINASNARIGGLPFAVDANNYAAFFISNSSGTAIGGGLTSNASTISISLASNAGTSVPNTTLSAAYLLTTFSYICA